MHTMTVSVSGGKATQLVKVNLSFTQSCEGGRGRKPQCKILPYLTLAEVWFIFENVM